MTIQIEVGDTYETENDKVEVHRIQQDYQTAEVDTENGTVSTSGESHRDAQVYVEYYSYLSGMTGKMAIGEFCEKISDN